MKKIVLMILVLVGMLFPLAILAKKAPIMSSDYSKPILLRSTNRMVVVSLPSNKTTGYSWFLGSYKSQFIEPLSQTYQAPNTKMAGAPGVSRWSFTVNEVAFKVPQIIHITMIYARPWDMRDARRKIITIVTQPDQ